MPQQSLAHNNTNNLQTNNHPMRFNTLIPGHLSPGRAAAMLAATASTLFAILPQARGITIYSDAADGQVEMRSDWTSPAIQNTNDWNMGVGEWYGNGLLSAVMPFQLPDVGMVTNPFTSATFGVNLFEMGNATVTDLDLYGVRVNEFPEISASDYYSGAGPDPGATLIQASFLTPASTTASAGPASGPNNFTDEAGSAALLAYLNSAYDGGAAAGEYVFLRVSYASDEYATSWDAYKFTSRNAALEGDWPVLTVVPEPGTYALLALSALALAARTVRRRR